jgi:hypothetical protein
MSGFFDKLSINSGIELELGPSRIKDFFDFLRHFVLFALIYFFMISTSKIYHKIHSKLNIKM